MYAATYSNRETSGTQAVAKKNYGYAVRDWFDTVSTPITDTTYTDTSMEPFANAFNYKNLKVGCAYQYCVSSSKLAVACVYNEKTPNVGDQVYLGNAKKNNGNAEPEPPQPTTGMTEECRTQVVDIHNKYRFK
ncbi:unnamed protein product [Strongylus vulgaris]|uniref:SCP domain-containing protein n=1 Tax=Strongylus vulgaris TaxID=40348 RepID=A0A3P7LH22_STRVU|nr:unnamed protein product [Strongylus vulgaris]